MQSVEPGHEMGSREKDLLGEHMTPVQSDDSKGYTPARERKTETDTLTFLFIIYFFPELAFASHPHLYPHSVCGSSLCLQSI